MVRPRLSVLSCVAALALAAPAAALPAHAASSGRTVSAVVQVRDGVRLPLAVAGGTVTRTFPHLGSELVRAPMAALQRLAADPRVAGVSPDRTGHFLSRGYGEDGDRSPDGVYASAALPGTGSPDTGRGINVALLDTGVSDTAALNRASGRITDGVDVSHLAAGGPARTSGQFTDGYGHGTFLASLIAGGPVPGSGGTPLGVAPAARIVVVKVADADGSTSLSEVLAGMDWVAAHARAIQVVNVALAVDRPTAPAYGADPLTAAVEHVRAAGVLVVAAVGNTPGEVGDPGLDPQALTVGAADVSGRVTRIAPFSGNGVVAGVSKPDVVASGVHVLGLIGADSTVAQQHPEGWQPNGLFRGSGTSEATAVASGLAAAYLAQHPDVDPLTVKTALRTAATGGRGVGRMGDGLVQLPDGDGNGHGRGNGNANGNGNGGRGRWSAPDTGEDGFDAGAWQAAAWRGGDWVDLLASSWSGPAWDASSWSASSWSASSWSASSWSASSWSASSWSASSWSASSWSASSWSASSWSSYSWGGDE